MKDAQSKVNIESINNYLMLAPLSWERGIEGERPDCFYLKEILLLILLLFKLNTAFNTAFI